MGLIRRPRRLRQNGTIRRLVRETKLSVDDLIYPLFVVEGKNIKKEIKSMPGVYSMSLDNLLKELEKVQKANIPAVILFGTINNKDETGSESYNDNGVIQKTLRQVKKSFPDILFIADTCLCSYTSHGHCGIVKNGKIENDASADVLVKSALSFASAGADIIAPSDMMDGRVLAIRRALDDNGFSDKIIMSYSAKFSSSFYGPFREAANSKPAFGDRKTYQMDYCNINEAILEIELDIAEGADIVMIKPALAYLDVISKVKSRINIPLAVYNVSGEYSMIKAAAQNGWIDEKPVVIEILTALKRAGADIIITYFAPQLAVWLKDN
ncbi:MAG: porphobilinogen synthase [Candidatus Humimicrobiaceae bacterium]